MDKGFSLISFDGASDVVCKLLEMIEKAIGWIAVPKGKRQDMIEALAIYKKGIEQDDNLTPIMKAAKIASANRELKEYINQAKIIAFACEDLDSSAEPELMEDDWLTYFFDCAKHISKDEIQILWAKILVEKANGNKTVNKKLINILRLIENEDIDVFIKICNLSFQNYEKDLSVYPAIYIVSYPSYYNNLMIRRHKLNSLDQLGLIEYNSNTEFVLPRKPPKLLYGNRIIELKSDKRISIGNVRFTNEGALLCRITQREYKEEFIDKCTSIWNSRNIEVRINE